MSPEERKAARQIVANHGGLLGGTTLLLNVALHQALDALDQADKDVRTALILAAAKQRQVDERDALLREAVDWIDVLVPPIGTVPKDDLCERIRALIGPE